jgi:hypothetical protein
LLPDSLLQFLQYTPLLLATLILIAVYQPWTLIPAFGIGILVTVIVATTSAPISALKQQDGSLSYTQPPAPIC